MFSMNKQCSFVEAIDFGYRQDYPTLSTYNHDVNQFYYRRGMLATTTNDQLSYARTNPPNPNYSLVRHTSNKSLLSRRDDERPLHHFPTFSLLASQIYQQESRSHTTALHANDSSITQESHRAKYHLQTPLPPHAFAELSIPRTRRHIHTRPFQS